MLWNQVAIEDRPSVPQASSQTPVAALENAVTAVLEQKQEVYAVAPLLRFAAGGTHPPFASYRAPHAVAQEGNSLVLVKGTIVVVGAPAILTVRFQLVNEVDKVRREGSVWEKTEVATMA